MTTVSIRQNAPVSIKINKMVATDILSPKKPEPCWVPGYHFVGFVSDGNGDPMIYRGQRFVIVRKISKNGKPFPMMEDCVRFHK